MCPNIFVIRPVFHDFLALEDLDPKSKYDFFWNFDTKYFKKPTYTHTFFTLSLSFVNGLTQ